MHCQLSPLSGKLDVTVKAAHKVEHIGKVKILMPEKPRSGLDGAPYRWYVGAQCVSLAGTTMTLAGLYWLAVTISHGNGIFLSVIVALQFLPVLIFSRRSGVIVSRYRPAHLLVVTQSLQLIGSLAYAIPLFMGWMSMWYLSLITFLLGFVTTLDSPTRQMFMLDLVGGDKLRKGSSLYGMFTGLAKIIGPSVAGLIIAAQGEATVFAVDSASFLFVIAVLLRFSDQVENHSNQQNSSREGARRFRWVLDLPRRIQVIAALALLFGGFGYQFEVTNPLMADHVFHLGSTGYGIMGTCIAAGGIIGSYYSSRREDPGLPEVLAWAGLFGLAEAGAAVMRTPWAYDVFMLAIGLATSLFASSSTVYIQRTVSGEQRGKSLAAYNAGFMGFVPAGAFLVAELASSVGVRWALIGPGLLLLGFALLGFFRTWSTRAPAQEATE